MWSLQTGAGSRTLEELRPGAGRGRGSGVGPDRRTGVLYRRTDAAFQGRFHQFCVEPTTVRLPRAY